MTDTTERTWTTAQGFAEGRQNLVFHRCRVVCNAGPDRGKSWSVDGPTLRIGTSDSCEVRLSDRTVSRCHGVLRLVGDRYVMADQGSRNGTFVNDVRVIEAFVAPGMRFQIGETQLSFTSEQHVAALDERTAPRLGQLITHSPPMQTLATVLERVAPSGLTCVLSGETGVGKEVVARTIHHLSPRREGPFVVVDCASLHDQLVEAELFGHEPGAFTGADRARIGAFERAQGGTILLDEIGELPLQLQPKLLRVLERREVQPLGSGEPRSIDVRVLAATHRDLQQLVELGTFREDLYFRLGEFVAFIPPLRSRPEDLDDLLRALFEDLNVADTQVGPGVVERLRLRPWPGNIRELRNWVRRACALGGNRLDLDLVETIDVMEPSLPAKSTAELVPVNEHLAIRDARGGWAATLEREYLSRVLRAADHDLDRVADHVGLGRKQLRRLLVQRGLAD